MIKPFNLAESLRSVPAEEQATLAALLDSMHITRFLRFPLPTRETISQDIEEAAKHFRSVSGEERVRFLRNEIARRLDAPAYVSDEGLTAMLLQSVASKYGIASDLPPLTVCREILLKGVTELIKQYLQAYANADEIKRREMDAQLQQGLRSLSPEMLQQLRDMAGAEHLTAESVREVMQTFIAGGGTLLFVNSLGFSAYIALSVLIHTVFTTVLGITLPFGVYTAASSVLSVLTGPVGWLALASLVVSWSAFKGRQLNQQLLSMALLTALLRWWQDAKESGEDVQNVMLPQPVETLPAQIQQQTTQLQQLQRKHHEVSHQLKEIQQRVEGLRRNLEREKARVHDAVGQSQQHRDRAEQVHLALRSANDLVSRLRQAVASEEQENEILRMQLAHAVQRLEQLESEYQAALQLAEEMERKAVEAQEQLQKMEEESSEQIRQLIEKKNEMEVNLKVVTTMLDELKAQRKTDFTRRFERLMPNLLFHEKALGWFAEQTNQEVLLAAEKTLLDIHYSAYPAGGWKRIHGTRCEETRFAGDYRIYFEVSGSYKTILTIGHKNTQTQDILWLLQRYRA